jgi:4-hydroxy 2-oxovalerate aldolase
MGYNVTFNLMGISLLSREELTYAIEYFSKAKMDVLYFSDSFGDLNHGDILDCISLIRQNYPGKIGIHTHDNNGLAFANTLSAIDNGVDFIDCTVMGMGRGAGNLRTEQILLHLYFKKGYTHLNPSELLDVINTHITPLHQEYRWGWDYTYMLSALQNIHPTYCMNLRASNQYSIEQVSSILNGIAHAKRKKYDEAALLEAIETVVNEPLMQESPSFVLPHYIPKHADTILVLATGPGVDRFRDELIEFIRQRQPFVIECNPKHEFFGAVADNYIISILNWVRLKKRLDNPPESEKPLVTGITALPEKYSNISYLSAMPCHVGKDEMIIAKDRFTLPAYVVGMFSVALALLSTPKTIYLAGFDGFQNGSDPRQQEMISFWKNMPKSARLLSVTPTTYSLEVEPVYKLIR